MIVFDMAKKEHVLWLQFFGMAAAHVPPNLDGPDITAQYCSGFADEAVRQVRQRFPQLVPLDERPKG